MNRLARHVSRPDVRAITMACFIVLCSVPFLTAAAAAEIGDFSISPANGISVGGIHWVLTHFPKGWHPVTRQGPQAFPSDAGFPRAQNDVYENQGRFLLTGGGDFRFTERLKKTEGGAQYTIRLEQPDGVECASLCLRMTLPASALIDADLFFDGSARRFGAAYDAKNRSFNQRNVRRLDIPLATGVLTFTGDLHVLFQDNRAYKQEVFEIRIHPAPSSGKIHAAELDMDMAFTPHRSVPVSLASMANRAFADEVAGDGKGGWTDQGRDNDLRALPTGGQNFAGIPFHIPAPDENDGRACVVFHSTHSPGLPKEAALTLPQPVTARHLYVLHATGWSPRAGTKIGTVSVEVDQPKNVDKAVLDYDIVEGREVANFWGPAELENARVAWRGRNPSNEIGLYLTRLDLPPEAIRSVSFRSEEKGIWMVAGLTFSDQRVDPKQQGGVTITAGGDFIPLRNAKDIVPGSALDFSRFLHTPAGKHGAVRVAGEHFEFAGRPGVPARFYGANICFDANFTDHESSDRMAKEFAASGYNLVRFHHFDGALADGKSGSSLHSHAWRRERMDYLAHAFRQNGVYITLDLFTYRKTLPDEVIPGRTLSTNEYKALVFLDDRARENLQEYARRLLTAINPHTGLAWKDDPAVAFLSLVNEDTIFHTVRASAYVLERYEKAFAQHAAERGWGVTPENRPQYWRRFLSETYRAGHAKLAAFLRNELGVRQPLSGQNFWRTLSVTAMREDFDYVDTHFYWGHPVFLGEKPWGPPMKVRTDAAVAARGGPVAGSGPPRLYGKPFVISEWNFVPPNPYAVEGAFLLGAYAAAQDWSGLARFAYSHGPDRVKNDHHPFSMFDVANIPMMMLSERAGSLFFLRGDVSPSKANYPVLMARDHGWSQSVDDFPAALSRLTLLGRTGTLLTDAENPATLPADIRAVVALGDAPSPDQPAAKVLTPAAARHALNLDGDTFTNDTGEIHLDAARNRFLVSTPRSEAYLLEEGDELKGRFATIRNGSFYAAILCAAVDDLPLAASKRLLILHLTDTKNTNARFRDPEMTIVESVGELPLLVRPGSAELVVNRALDGFTLHALDVDGRRLFAVPFEIRDEHSYIPLKTRHGERAVLAYELTRE